MLNINHSRFVTPKLNNTNKLSAKGLREDIINNRLPEVDLKTIAPQAVGTAATILYSTSTALTPVTGAASLPPSAVPDAGIATTVKAPTTEIANFRATQDVSMFGEQEFRAPGIETAPVCSTIKPVEFISYPGRGSVKIIKVTEDGLAEPIPEFPAGQHTRFVIDGFSEKILDLDGDVEHLEKYGPADSGYVTKNPEAFDETHGGFIAKQMHHVRPDDNIVGLDVTACDAPKPGLLDSLKILNAFEAVGKVIKDGDTVNMSFGDALSPEYAREIMTDAYVYKYAGKQNPRQDPMVPYTAETYEVMEQAFAGKDVKVTVAAGNDGPGIVSTTIPDPRIINTNIKADRVGALNEFGRVTDYSGQGTVYNRGNYTVKGIEEDEFGNKDCVSYLGDNVCDARNSDLSKGIEPGEYGKTIRGTSFAAPAENVGYKAPEGLARDMAKYLNKLAWQRTDESANKAGNLI